MSISKIARLSTTLRREEAWELDDIAQSLGVRRSHVMRAMLRYVLQARLLDFQDWLAEQDEHPVESPDDPTPTPTDPV